MVSARRLVFLLPLLPVLLLSCGERGFGPVWGSFAFNNANDHEIAIYMRTLRSDLLIDCEALASDPGAVLVDEAFGEARHWLLPPRTSVASFEDWREDCTAALVGGEGIEPRVVFVDLRDGGETFAIFEGQTLESSALGERHVGVTFDEAGRATWVGDTDIVHTPTSAPEALPPECQAEDEQRLDWSDPMPRGRFELLALEPGIDDCAELTLQPIRVSDTGVEAYGEVEVAYVCTPPTALFITPGELLDFGDGRNETGLRRLSITLADPETLQPALDEGGEYLRATSYYRDASLQAYRTRAFPDKPEPEREWSCPWRRVDALGCATVERAFELYLDGILVEPGVEIQIADPEDGVLYRSTPTFIRDRAIVDPSCSGGLPEQTLDYAITLEPTP